MYNPFSEIAAIFNKKYICLRDCSQPLRTSGFLVFFEVFVRVRICICKTLSALPIKISRWILLLQDFAGYNSLCFLFLSNAYHLALNSGFLLSNNKNSAEVLFWDLFLLPFQMKHFSSKLLYEHFTVWKQKPIWHHVLSSSIICYANRDAYRTSESSRLACTRGLYKQWKIYNVSNKYFQEKTDYKSKYKRIWIEKEKKIKCWSQKGKKGNSEHIW